MIGGYPRMPGMERKDLIEKNAEGSYILFLLSYKSILYLPLIHTIALPFIITLPMLSLVLLLPQSL